MELYNVSPYESKPDGTRPQHIGDGGATLTIRRIVGMDTEKTVRKSMQLLRNIGTGARRSIRRRVLRNKHG